MNQDQLYKLGAGRGAFERTLDRAFAVSNERLPNPAPETRSWPFLLRSMPRSSSFTDTQSGGAKSDAMLERITAEGWSAGQRVSLLSAGQIRGFAKQNPYKTEPECARWAKGFAGATGR